MNELPVRRRRSRPDLVIHVKKRSRRKQVSHARREPRNGFCKLLARNVLGPGPPTVSPATGDETVPHPSDLIVSVRWGGVRKTPRRPSLVDLAFLFLACSPPSLLTHVERNWVPHPRRAFVFLRLGWVGTNVGGLKYFQCSLRTCFLLAGISHTGRFLWRAGARSGL